MCTRSAKTGAAASASAAFLGEQQHLKRRNDRNDKEEKSGSRARLDRLCNHRLRPDARLPSMLLQSIDCC